MFRVGQLQLSIVSLAVLVYGIMGCKVRHSSQNALAAKAKFGQGPSEDQDAGDDTLLQQFRDQFAKFRQMDHSPSHSGILRDEGATVSGTCIAFAPARRNALDYIDLASENITFNFELAKATLRDSTVSLRHFEMVFRNINRMELTFPPDTGNFVFILGGHNSEWIWYRREPGAERAIQALVKTTTSDDVAFISISKTQIVICGIDGSQDVPAPKHSSPQYKKNLRPQPQGPSCMLQCWAEGMIRGGWDIYFRTDTGCPGSLQCVGNLSECSIEKRGEWIPGRCKP